MEFILSILIYTHYIALQANVACHASENVRQRWCALLKTVCVNKQSFTCWVFFASYFSNFANKKHLCIIEQSTKS